jgi:hypothetical protein
MSAAFVEHNSNPGSNRTYAKRVFFNLPVRVGAVGDQFATVSLRTRPCVNKMLRHRGGGKQRGTSTVPLLDVGEALEIALLFP